ncbi:ATP-dependent Clp protease ATP-binding protein subunit ClpB [Fonsecaea nubica]|uniref:ATP-dependent Clp protease ATP-binding protein subunit ClpB n=1 Tax=Fonsecaea nubica TaxID=856822 RepID=A0A178CW28_9EURO|nr:ATP-dependent Clp protease ATP-binding protein subunit ClpB [Fonsecaea nubica]OAL34049.1 ATP-dependent Clp protease ATP-binding protein subunit ClpB [Fonsecaea nubica]
MSIACIITTADLAPLDTEGFEAVIFHTPEQLSRMSEWCVETHGNSGLTQACLVSSTSAEEAATKLLAYIKHYIPEPGRALLAGNSIHADRAFLAIPPWNVILQHLHYRLFDVSAMKEMVRRWASDSVLMAAPRKELKHTARADVLESIQEAQYYKRLIEGMSLGIPVVFQPCAPRDLANMKYGMRILAPVPEGELTDIYGERANRDARTGLNTDKAVADDLDNFPVEKARLRVMWFPMTATICSVVAFGWALHYEKVYYIYPYLVDSAGHPGGPSRQIAYNDMLYLCERYGPSNTLETYDPRKDIGITGTHIPFVISPLK